MFYLDTCVLVSAFGHEASTAEVTQWLAIQHVTQLRISDWQITEFSSALSLKLRTRQINVVQRNGMLAQFVAYKDSLSPVLPVSSRDFIEAAHMVEQHHTGLRANDALHLAIAMHNRLCLVSLDERLVNAARLLAVDTHLLNTKNHINE